MHGLGNDFVIMDCRDGKMFLSDAQIIKIADRHRGVGFDQLVTLHNPTMAGADVMLRFFNADASESGACGNASRCVAQLLFQQTGRHEAVLQTQAGLLPVWGAGHDALGAPLYSVDFAKPEFAWDKIPLAQAMDTLRVDLAVAGLSSPCVVNVGNPHTVFFVDDVMAIPLDAIGADIECHPLFPQRVNVEICQVMSANQLRMRVWERGVGITQACGSGAVATMVAAARRGLIGRKADVVLDGGVLNIEWRADDRVILTGTASAVYSGQFDPQFLAE